MGQALVLAGQSITPAVLNRIYGDGDTVEHTVVAASLSNLSSVYQIPALDAGSGTAYRITTFAEGTWGSTQQALTISAAVGDVARGRAPVIAAGVLSAGATFDCEITATVICVTAGPSGTWTCSARGVLTQTANPITPGTAADNSVAFCGIKAGAFTLDSTIAEDQAIQVAWASTVGSPSVTSYGTLFEKVN